MLNVSRDGNATEISEHDKDPNKFWQRVSQMPRFKKLVEEQKKVHSCFEEVCCMCWDLHLKDLVQFQRRVDDLNMSSMKQTSALKEQLRPTRRNLVEVDDSELVEFYEPLKYLEESTQMLVCTIVREKLTQLAVQGSAPASVLKAIGPLFVGEFGEWKKKTEEKLDASQKEVAALRHRLESCLEQVATLEDIITLREKELQESLARQEALQAEIEEMNQELETAQLEIDQLQKDKQRLQDEKAGLEEQMVNFEQRIKDLEDELERVRQELASVQEKLQEAHQEIVMLQEVRCQLEQQIKELQKRVGQLEARVKHLIAENAKMMRRCIELTSKLEAAEARAEAAEAEAEELREELARRNNTKTTSTQTTLHGAQFDRQREELREFKGMMTDMRVRLVHLVKEFGKKGLKDMALDLLQKAGFKMLFTSDNCWDRLHEDAADRSKRLEQLQEEYGEERLSEFEQRHAAHEGIAQTMDGNCNSEPDLRLVPLSLQSLSLDTKATFFTRQSTSAASRKPSSPWCGMQAKSDCSLRSIDDWNRLQSLPSLDVCKLTPRPSARLPAAFLREDNLPFMVPR